MTEPWQIQEDVPPEEPPPDSLVSDQDAPDELTAEDLEAIKGGVALPEEPAPRSAGGGAQGRGWGPGWPTARNADQVKVTRGAQGVWVHQGIASLVREGLRRTEEEIRYDVRMLGGYNSRPIRGSTKTPSNHSWGLAVDINWDKNPMISGRLVTDMPSAVVQAWKSLGFGWGGDYKTRKDAMHFEFMGTPTQAATLIAALGSGSGAGGIVQGGAGDSPVLRMGSKGEPVRILQGRLNAHGSSLATDGDFGKRTHGAVVGFQRAKGLVADGIVGPRTWAALG